VRASVGPGAEKAERVHVAPSRRAVRRA